MFSEEKIKAPKYNEAYDSNVFKKRAKKKGFNFSKKKMDQQEIIEINERPNFLSKNNPIFKTLDDTDIPSRLLKNHTKKKPENK